MMRINSNPDQNEGMAIEIKMHKLMQTAFNSWCMMYLNGMDSPGKLATKKTAYSKRNKLSNSHSRALRAPHLLYSPS